jgi:hypothetical protein
MSEIERALRFEEQRARLFQDYAQSSYVNMRRLVACDRLAEGFCSAIVGSTWCHSHSLQTEGAHRSEQEERRSLNQHLDWRKRRRPNPVTTS